MTSVDLNRLLSWPFLLAFIGHGLAVLQGPLVWVLAAQHAAPLTVLVVAAIALGARDLPASRRARSTALRCAGASVVTTRAVVFCFPLVSAGLNLLPDVVMAPVIIGLGMVTCSVAVHNSAHLETRIDARPVELQSARAWRPEQTQAGIGGTLELEYLRDGATTATEVDARGGPAIGVQGTFDTVPMPLAQVPAEIAETVSEIALAVAAFPQKVTELAVTTFTDAPRAEDSPMSVVGVGDLSGQIVAAEGIPDSTKLYFLILLLAGLNLSLFFFNLLPLPPLDGGHIATAVASSARRRLAARRGAADPGHISPAVLMPLTLSVLAVYVLIGLVTISADFIEPVRLFE